MNRFICHGKLFQICKTFFPSINKYIILWVSIDKQLLQPSENAVFGTIYFLPENARFRMIFISFLDPFINEILKSFFETNRNLKLG